MGEGCRAVVMSSCQREGRGIEQRRICGRSRNKSRCQICYGSDRANSLLSDSTPADHLRIDPLDQTILTYMDTGEPIPCDIVVLRDAAGSKIHIT